MGDDDLIRRGDALAAAADLYRWSIAAGEELEAAIAAIPARGVGVPSTTQPCTWPTCGCTAKGQFCEAPVRWFPQTASAAQAREAEPEMCGKCMGSGYGGHPDSGVLCPDCNGTGGISSAPDVLRRMVFNLE